MDGLIVPGIEKIYYREQNGAELGYIDLLMGNGMQRNCLVCINDVPFLFHFCFTFVFK